MNSNTITITLQTAITYYQKGGELRKLAEQAFPNIKQEVENAKERNAQQDKIKHQAFLDDIGRRFPIDTLLFNECNDQVYKVTSSPKTHSKHKVYIECVYAVAVNTFQRCMLVFDDKGKKWTMVICREALDSAYAYWHNDFQLVKAVGDRFQLEGKITQKFHSKIQNYMSQIDYLSREIEHEKREITHAMNLLSSLIEHGS